VEGSGVKLEYLGMVGEGHNQETPTGHGCVTLCGIFYTHKIFTHVPSVSFTPNNYIRVEEAENDRAPLSVISSIFLFLAGSK